MTTQMKAACTYICMSFHFDTCDYVDFVSPNLLLLTVGGSLRAAEDVVHVGQPPVADVTAENNNVDSEGATADDSSDQDHESENDTQEDPDPDPSDKIENIVLEDQQPDNQDMSVDAAGSTQEAEPSSSSVPPPPPVPSEPTVRRPRARRAVVTEGGPRNVRHGQASIFGPNTVFIGSVTFVERTDQQAGLRFHKMHASTRVIQEFHIVKCKYRFKHNKSFLELINVLFLCM